jgi:hypothetical protein
VPSALGARASRGASSGKLIWTGFLADNRVLTIQGKRPSSGSLSGQLPRAPVRITAYPAELSSSGLTVFSANPEHSGRSVTEAPGPRNAWNRTTYRWAPERAGSLEVVEAPGRQNNWGRLVLRATGQALPVIVVDWELIR